MADRPETPLGSSDTGPAEEPRVVRRPRNTRARWSTPKRIVAGFGVALLVGGAALAAGTVWGLWSFTQIARVDLDLAAREPTEPRNFLVVGSDSRDGIDADDPGAGGMLSDEARGRRSDSLMIARVDPDSDRIDLLSIPRDLWVPIAGTGEEQRINTAYAKSAQAVVDTVQSSLGLPVHQFVEVDFKGFSQLIDTLGGVPMYFDSPVRDTNSGLFVDEAGCRVLDGRDGLAFARSRSLQWSDGVEWHSDPSGDLGRMTRQQLLTRASLAKAQTMGIGDVGRLKGLVDAGVDSVTLDATLGTRDLVDLGGRIAELDPDRMQTHGLPVVGHRTSGGASVLLLDEAAAQPVLDLFRGSVAPAPVTTTTAPPPSAQQVTVQVANGTGVEGEARRVSYVLSTGGFREGTVEPADTVAETVITYPSRSRAMAVLVASWLSPEAELVEDEDLFPTTVRVTLGRDFESVAEPSDAPDDEQVDEGGSGGGDEDSVPGDDTTATIAAPTTTTTQPGWTPGQPPEGVTCS